MIALERLDHLVLSVSDVEASCEFYAKVLGCQIVCFQSASGEDRFALRVGDSPQKINLHSAEHPFWPAAIAPQPGSADLCFITATPLDEVMKHFGTLDVPIIAGPVQRTGTLGPILSIYIRDLDGNLIEVAKALNADLQ
jgi:catechol 2,3-dioxygenase-like lactoylglutathione lyase family enzyme